MSEMFHWVLWAIIIAEWAGAVGANFDSNVDVLDTQYLQLVYEMWKRQFCWTGPLTYEICANFR
jgi:hypothetical protein